MCFWLLRAVCAQQVHNVMVRPAARLDRDLGLDRHRGAVRARKNQRSDYEPRKLLCENSVCWHGRQVLEIEALRASYSEIVRERQRLVSQSAFYIYIMAYKSIGVVSLESHMTVWEMAAQNPLISLTSAIKKEYSLKHNFSMIHY